MQKKKCVISCLMTIENHMISTVAMFLIEMQEEMHQVQLFIR